MKQSIISFHSPEEGPTFHYRGFSFVQENGAFLHLEKGKLTKLKNTAEVRTFVNLALAVKEKAYVFSRTVLGITRTFGNPIQAEQWAVNVLRKRRGFKSPDDIL